jgi:hypothetical protein
MKKNRFDKNVNRKYFYKINKSYLWTTLIKFKCMLKWVKIGNEIKKKKYTIQVEQWNKGY